MYLLEHHLSQTKKLKEFQRNRAHSQRNEIFYLFYFMDLVEVYLKLESISLPGRPLYDFSQPTESETFRAMKKTSTNIHQRHHFYIYLNLFWITSTSALGEKCGRYHFSFIFVWNQFDLLLYHLCTHTLEGVRSQMKFMMANISKKPFYKNAL